MRLFNVSATYRIDPVGSMAIPCGQLNAAVVSFCTSPFDVIVRIQLFPVSDTYIILLQSITILEGLEKMAFVPRPSANATRQIETRRQPM